MIYGMIDEAKREYDQVDNCITMEASRFSDLHPTEDLHDIAATRVRLY